MPDTIGQNHTHSELIDFQDTKKSIVGVAKSCDTFNKEVLSKLCKMTTGLYMIQLLMRV